MGMKVWVLSLIGLRGLSGEQTFSYIFCLLFLLSLLSLLTISRFNVRGVPVSPHKGGVKGATPDHLTCTLFFLIFKVFIFNFKKIKLISLCPIFLWAKGG